MAISFVDATRSLLGGKQLAWAAFEDHKAGSLALSQPVQRRLFAFLLSGDPAKVARGDEESFAGLIAAWNEDALDPAVDETNTITEPSKDVWRLQRIEASGFGGLTLFGGPPFDLWVNGENWCLNGQNGSGKTSLASAILWALTGKRIREQEGPIDEHGARSIVTSDTGKRLGDWPSFASYPASAADLIKPVEVWVKLTFVNQDGEAATAHRRMVCPLKGSPTSEVAVDPRLLAAPELLEAGLLMPARLTRIGFGDKSGSLYEAVKMLTGLDQLADIAEGCSQLNHRGRRFLKFGRDNGLERWETKFTEEVAKAVEKADELQFALPERVLGGEALVTNFKDVAKNAADEARAHLATLKSEIAPAVDTTDPQTGFEPRNKRKWAQELALLANTADSTPEGLQLYLTTYEREFYQCMVDVEQLKGERGLIGGVNKTFRVVTIVNGSCLERAWREATDNNDDERARDYISDVRIYCEDLSKFMLRGEAST